MSNRRFALPVNGKQVASDYSKLVWRDSMGPLQAIADALNVAIRREQQRLVTVMAQHDHIDINEYVLNVDTMEWVLRPQEMRANNDPAPSHPSG